MFPGVFIQEIIGSPSMAHFIDLFTPRAGLKFFNSHTSLPIWWIATVPILDVVR